MIYVTKEVINDENLSADAVMAYVFLQVLTYSPNYDSVTFNISQLVDQMYGVVNSHSMQSKVKESFKEIIDNGYLDVVKESPLWWRIYMSSYKETAGGYVVVDANNIRDIVDEENLRNRPLIIRYYLLLLSSIYSKTKVGTNNQDWFCTKLNVSRQTLSKYNKILTEKKLIYIYHSALTSVSNTYGRYEDAEFVRIEGNKRSHGHEAHENANTKRKCVAMYRRFLEGKEYDKETLNDIYNVMRERNNEILNLGKSARAEAYDLQPLIDKISQE